MQTEPNASFRGSWKPKHKANGTSAKPQTTPTLLLLCLMKFSTISETENIS